MRDCLVGQSFEVSYVVDGKSYVSAPRGPCKGPLPAGPVVVHYLTGDPATARLEKEEPVEMLVVAAVGALMAAFVGTGASLGRDGSA